jgi:hypothetical protein
MNYRIATRQQLLVERARLTNVLRKAEQRSVTGRQARGPGGGASRRERGSAGPAQREVEQLNGQIDAELARRDALEPQQEPDAEASPASES